MATDTRGLPLDEYTRSCPPGWKPHMTNYPLRTFIEKLRLWKRQTELDEAVQGPVVVGRLKGAAYRIAMKIRVRRQNGFELMGDEAVAAPAEPELVDSTPACRSGLEDHLPT